MALETILQNDRIAYPWFAPAGDTRGQVPATSAIGYTDGGEFKLAEMDDGLLDTLYINNINPIVNFPNEGIKVWGQKTLTSVPSAMDRINVARLVAYMRYMLDRITRPFLFEQNDAQTRQAVVNVVEKFLAEIVQKRGISDFVVVCDASNNTPARIDRNELWVDISVVPTKSVEFIYIPVRLLNTGEL
jgi:phage tail sheath protein FI